MCIRIYFVDKEIVQHCGVSVKCGMRLGFTQVEKNSRNLAVGFDQSHCLVTGCPGAIQECNQSAHILPFWR